MLQNTCDANRIRICPDFILNLVKDAKNDLF